jgi:hypothetical protein
MSSKSSKHTNDPRHTPKPAGHVPAPGAKPVHGEVEYAEPTEKDFLDEELKTPKGKSPIVYAGLVLLLIFLTVLFVLPDGALQGGGRGDDPVVVRWTDPERGPRQLTASQFTDARARFEAAFDNGGAMVAMGLAFTGFVTDIRRPTELDILRLVVTDEQAVAAGIEVTDQELAQAIRERILGQADAALYEQRLRQLTHIGGVRGFEETLRRLLRIQRYVELTSLAATVPQKSDIETAWHTNHQEYRFEWAAADVANFDAAARATVPTDAELETWLANLSEFDRSQYRTPAKFKAEIAGLRPSLTTDYTLLDAAYPRPEGWDDAVEGDAFYKQRYFTLYTKPAPVTPEGETPVEQMPEYFSYEEVKERAARDARTFAALRDWHTELFGKIAIDESVDLAAEAARLGLEYVAAGEAMTMDQWRDLGGLSSLSVAARIASMTTVGEMPQTVVVGTDAFVVPRLVERVDQALPPVADIREQLTTRWYEEKRTQLAREAVTTLRSSLLPAPTPSEGEGEAAPAPKTTVTAEEFAAAATAAGLRLGAREWLDRQALQSEDPSWNDPVHTLIRATAPLFALEEGALSSVLVPFTAIDSFYVVRAAGKREIPFEKIRTAAFQDAMQSARQTAARSFLTEGPFSDASLRSRYQVWLLSEQEEPATEPTAG